MIQNNTECTRQAKIVLVIWISQVDWSTPLKCVIVDFIASIQFRTIIRFRKKQKKKVKMKEKLSKFSNFYRNLKLQKNTDPKQLPSTDGQQQRQQQQEQQTETTTLQL